MSSSAVVRGVAVGDSARSGELSIGSDDNSPGSPLASRVSIHVYLMKSPCSLCNLFWGASKHRVSCRVMNRML